MFEGLGGAAQFNDPWLDLSVSHYLRWGNFDRPFRIHLRLFDAWRFLGNYLQGTLSGFNGDLCCRFLVRFLGGEGPIGGVHSWISPR